MQCAVQQEQRDHRRQGRLPDHAGQGAASAVLNIPHAVKNEERKNARCPQPEVLQAVSAAERENRSRQEPDDRQIGGDMVVGGADGAGQQPGQCHKNGHREMTG